MKNILLIMTLLIVMLVTLIVILIQQKLDITELKFSYYGEVITPSMVHALNAKDPEFFRFANNSLFKDENGYYYVVITAHLFPAILKTKDFKTYEFVTTINNLVGKVAPYVIYNPQDNNLYLFYSDWLNTIKGDITYAKLGLAIGKYKSDIALINFEDQGYLKIIGSPLIDASAGWDPYIVKINETYFMVYSSAVHGVHLASANNLGTEWKYLSTIIHDNRENPALFQYENIWYMCIGTYDAPGYDLYSSKDFLKWKLVKSIWFRDPKYPILPAGSACVLIDKTLYYVYQVPLSTDYVSGPFSINLAYATLDR